MELAPSLPSWLSADTVDPSHSSDLDKRKPSPETRDMLHSQYEYVFMRVISEMARGQPLHQILAQEGRTLDYNDFYRWMKKDPQRQALFQEAQELRSEFHAGEILQIADAADSLEDVQRSRLRIETRRWLMGAHNKKRYGETKQIELNTSISITDALAQATARAVQGEVIEHDPSPLDPSSLNPLTFQPYDTE